MKRENPNYYSIIPAPVRYDARLKANEKLLFGEVTALANKEGYAFASNSYLAEIFGVAKETISRWLSHLSELGYIRIEIIRNEKNQIVERKIYPLMDKRVENQNDTQTHLLTKKSIPLLTKKSIGIDENVKENNKRIIEKNNNNGTSFVSSGSNEPSEQTTSYASQEKNKSDLPLNSKKVKKYNMASAENFNADGEKIDAPTQEGAQPTPKEGKARTKLFRNSIYSDYAQLVKRFKQMPEQRLVKYRGLDLDWYIEAVENWSEKKQVKRTDEGWFRTILDFMRRDMAEGKAQWLKGYNPNERENNSLYD